MCLHAACVHMGVCAQGRATTKSDCHGRDLEPGPEACSHPCGMAGPPASEAPVTWQKEHGAWSCRPGCVSSLHPWLAVWP